MPYERTCGNCFFKMGASFCEFHFGPDVCPYFKQRDATVTELKIELLKRCEELQIVSDRLGRIEKIICNSLEENGKELSIKNKQYSDLVIKLLKIMGAEGIMKKVIRKWLDRMVEGKEHYHG